MTLATQEGVVTATRLNQKIVIASIAMKNIVAALAIDQITAISSVQSLNGIGAFHQIRCVAVDPLFHVSD